MILGVLLIWFPLKIASSELSQTRCHISNYLQQTDIQPDSIINVDNNVTMLDCLQQCCTTQGET